MNESKDINLGHFKVKAREIGNGFLSNDGWNDYYFKDMDKCFGEFVNEEMPKQIVIGDPIEAVGATKDYTWTDVLSMIRETIHNAGDGFVEGNIDIELDIKVKAIVHEAN